MAQDQALKVEHKGRTSQTLYQPGANLSTFLSKGGLAKNIIVTSQLHQNLPTAKALSPRHVPNKYAHHLPNIIQRKIKEATSTSFQFNPSSSTSKNMLKDTLNQKKEHLKSLESI